MLFFLHRMGTKYQQYFGQQWYITEECIVVRKGTDTLEPMGNLKKAGYKTKFKHDGETKPAMLIYVENHTPAFYLSHEDVVTTIKSKTYVVHPDLARAADKSITANKLSGTPTHHLKK